MSDTVNRSVSTFRSNQGMNIFDIPEEKVTLMNKCLEATCVSLNFNVAEIWQFVPITGVSHSHDSNKIEGESVSEDTEAPICLHVYSRFDKLDRHKTNVVIVGSSIQEENESRNVHKISPQLCTIAHARKINSSLWYYSSGPKFDYGNENPLHNHDYYKVVAAIPVTAQSKASSCVCRFCVVFFSVNIVKPYSDVELFLEHMSKACILALTTDIHASREESQYRASIYSYSSAEDQSDHPCVSETQLMELPIDLDMKWSSLKDIEHVADGSKFTTYRAKYNSTNVAVKVVRKVIRNVHAAINYLETEMSFLLRCQHPNIVRLLGAGTTPEGFLVTEWVNGGTFLQLLKSGLFSVPGCKYFGFKSLPLSTVVLFGQQLAKAIHYLNDGAISNKTVIHGDLRPSNIGFCCNCNSKVCSLKLLDVGLAREIDQDCEANIDLIGASSPYGLFGVDSMNVLPLVNFYMSPEAAEMRSINEKSDVFSFAMLVWSLITFELPFATMDKDHYYAEVVRGNTRPPLPENTPGVLKEFLISCWDEDPEQRPSFADTIDIFQNMCEKYVSDDEHDEWSNVCASG